MAPSEQASHHERGRKRKYELPTMKEISREEAMQLLREAASSDELNPSKENEDFRRRVASVLSDKQEM